MSDTIEKARSLLADASPELRRVVGECIIESNEIGWQVAFMQATGGKTIEVRSRDKCIVDFARELIEGGEQ